MPPTSGPRLRLGFTTRMMQHTRMLKAKGPQQPKVPTMDSWADVVANIDRDTVDSSSDKRISVLSSIGEQCIYANEFLLLLKKTKGAPVCCVWFEPTLSMDLTQGLLKAMYVNKMVKAGYIVKIFIADMFAQRKHNVCNNKDIIRNIGCYNIEMWKAAGMDLNRVELVWFSDVLEGHATDYWLLALDVSRKCTLKRMASCCADRAPYGPLLPAAEIFYPCMQVAAVLCQKADIWLFSMDQQDTAMLSREYCEETKRETKPTIMLHNTLPNLVHDPYIPLKGLYNRRDPKWNIFMHDNEFIVNRKIMRAICPPIGAKCNPCLEYIKYAIFPWLGKFEVVQKERNGSNRAFACMEDLIVEYECGNLDPMDVKMAFENGIYIILKHVGNTFNSNAEAQALITALTDQIKPMEFADFQNSHCWNRETM